MAFGTEMPAMNKFLTSSLCAVMAATLAAQASPPDLIARIHFAGAEKISADTNSAAFTNFFCSAEARALRNQMLNKLSRFPYAWFKNRIAGTNDGAAQLRPLLDDLFQSEWLLEIRDTANGAPESALAIRLNTDRAQLWQNNIAGVLQSWTRLAPEKTSNGWLMKKDLPPNLVRFERRGDWVVIDCGQNELLLGDEILKPLVKTGTAAMETNWLTVDLDWPRLARWFAPLKEFDFPKVELQFVGRDGNLWSKGKFILAQPLPQLEKWRMPTNVIHQPFVSFMAVRDIGPWLERQSWARPYAIQPLPDQFFVWALPGIPLQTFIAAPVPDARAALVQLDAKLSPIFNADSQKLFTPVTIVLTNNEIDWHGMPFADPFVRTWHEPAGDFLFGGFFPNTPRSQPLPPELFQQLNKPNVVYYQWEMTGERLKELPPLTQLMLLITRYKQLDPNSAAHNWLNHIQPALGPGVTVLTQTGPNELNFLRKSRCGLTAIELMAIGNWLEAPNFPGCDLRIPQPSPRLRQSHIPGAPVRPAPAPPMPPH